MPNYLERIFSSIASTNGEDDKSGKRRRLYNRSGYKKARHYVYELLHTVTVETRAELVTKIILTTLILINMIAVVLETIPSIANKYGDLLYTFEIVTVMVFSIEYALRVWSIVEVQKYHSPISGRMRYGLSFFALIDLFAILPFFLPVIGFDLRFIRSLRLLRLLRILKLGQYSNSLGMLFRVAQKKKYDIGVSLSIILLLIIFAGCMLYFLEHEDQPHVVTDIPTTIWWGLAKLTALSYVEIIPVTIPGKVCDAILSFLGLSFFALPSGILAAGFVEEIESRKMKPICPHCGKDLNNS